MYRVAEERINRLTGAGLASRLRSGKRGLEKESLRINRDGTIAQTRHPLAWGSALTHPYVTTDYSEALAEFITPAFARTEDVFDFLHEVHQFAYEMLAPGELMWASSMPCALQDDRTLPIAEYGTSNIGRMKHVYRVGLDYRYGRRMQAIAGVHFNYSLPLDFWPAYREIVGTNIPERQFVDDHYFGLIRNFRRVGWIVPLLFGNSPVLCSSFLAGRTTRFKPFDACSYYLPYATSLRMSDIGYKNKNQAALNIAYDNLDDYVRSLSRAIATPYPEYEVIGLYDGDSRIQLNTSILQIENEFYSYMRPKRTTRPGERPTMALHERGVEYVEMRALDVYSYAPTGIAAEHLRVIEAFLIFCLLADSPRISASEQWSIEYNELTIALRGREPALELIRDGERVNARKWAEDILTALEPICEILDESTGSSSYGSSLRQQQELLREPDELPSARILRELRERRMTFFEYALELSRAHEAHFRANPLAPERREYFQHVAAESLAKQRTLEQDDEVDFATYLIQQAMPALPGSEAY